MPARQDLLVSIDWRLTLICLIVFALIVGATRYVSLGSLVVVTIFLAWMVVFGMMGEYGGASGPSAGILRGGGSHRGSCVPQTSGQLKPAFTWDGE